MHIYIAHSFFQHILMILELQCSYFGTYLEPIWSYLEPIWVLSGSYLDRLALISGMRGLVVSKHTIFQHILMILELQCNYFGAYLGAIWTYLDLSGSYLGPIWTDLHLFRVCAGSFPQNIHFSNIS